MPTKTTIPTTDGDLVIEHPTADIAVMRMPHMVDVYTAPAIREASVKVVNCGGYRIVADLTGVEMVDSTGLGVLVGMLKRARAHAGTVAVVIDGERIAKAFRITTMDKAFEIYPTVDDAVAALRPDDPAQSIETTIQNKQAEDSTADFPVVTLCGSMRFYPRLLDVAAELTAAGQIVLMPHDASLTGIENKTALEHGAMLDAMHRQKIRMSGSVYIVNTGGYIGKSTRSEIDYATALGMPIQYDEGPDMTDTAPETARLTADVVLFAIDETGTAHVLLIKRRWDPYEGCWALPGGHVDQGETTVDAARRELAEETGINVLGLTPTGAYAQPGRDPRGRYATFAYTARLTQLPTPTAADDATEARWIPLIELPFRGLAFDHYQIISDAGPHCGINVPPRSHDQQ